ncbi:C40 family peptidase [Streptomyces sp. NPDC001508]|uniref:C40 family peptidase n=1 Tax=Streptomyces sp. NPDC001508 TaxID=3154656 RepID=UPI00332E9358
MKGLAAGIGIIVLTPFLLGGAAIMMATSGDAAQRLNAADLCLPGLDIDAVAQQVTGLLDGTDASDIRVEGLDLPGEQIPNAQTIVATGIGMRIPVRGQIIALATALQESRLRNLGGGDRDSLGLFQQRPSQGWGTAQEIRDPVHASERFYEALTMVSGWQQMTLAQAAQVVQKSAHPAAYARWEPLATALQKAIAATFPSSGQSDEVPSLTGCALDGSSFGPVPEGAVPAGYEIPEATDPRARAAITWALQQLGTMYQWGGSCTAPRGPDPMGRCDCSSLTQQAYAHAGVALTRTTYTQVSDGKAVSPSRLRPGDLVFSRGSAARPEHVGLYLGEGLVIEAPRTGKPVRITPLKDWAVLAARRVI